MKASQSKIIGLAFILLISMWVISAMPKAEKELPEPKEPKISFVDSLYSVAVDKGKCCIITKDRAVGDYLYNAYLTRFSIINIRYAHDGIGGYYQYKFYLKDGIKNKDIISDLDRQSKGY